MKRLKSNSISILLSLSIIAFSCGEEDTTVGGTNGELTAEDASNSLNSMSGDMHTDLVEMVNSDGAEALVDLVDLLASDDIFSGRIDASAASAEAIKRRLQNIKRVFIPESVKMSTDEGRFDFTANLGVYNFNPTTQLFEKSEDALDNIQINFPTEGSATNNASLRILKYSDVKIINDNTEEYLPTDIIADLSIDETLVVSLGFTANFSLNGTPEAADISLFVIPFDYELKFQNTNTLSSSASFLLSKANESIIGASVEVVFKTETKEDVSSLTGEVSYRTVALKGDIDAAGIEAIDQGGTGDINDFINVALYDGENKIGDILIEETADGENVYVVFADGTKELLETVLEPVINEVEDFIMKLDGTA